MLTVVAALGGYRIVACGVFIDTQPPCLTHVFALIGPRYATRDRVVNATKIEAPVAAGASMPYDRDCYW